METLAVLAILSSSSFNELISLSLNAADATARSYEIGLIQNAPVPNLSPADASVLASLGRHAWAVKRSLDTRSETSHAFGLPALLRERDEHPTGTLAARALTWAACHRTAEIELAAIQAEIDDRCFDHYGIDIEDRRAITQGLGSAAKAASAADTAAETDLVAASATSDDGSDIDDSEIAVEDTTTLAAELLSWAVGVSFGRFDVRLATGARSALPEPDPFDPLPVCSPGMLTGDDGLPLAQPPRGYPLVFPADGVLLDDPGHPRDLTAAVRAVFDVVFGGAADARWREAAELLDPKGHDLRAWLSGAFFEHHLKRYSKSRRKAPILWQLATPSGSYSVWLYAHRLTSDTFFQVQNEYVDPKLVHEERKLAALVQDAGPHPTAGSRKGIDRQETFVEELRALREEVARVAPLWNPDLNDGVLLTAAPLWRLVPQHRAWQKELQVAWTSLCAGEYDWAHLAMHLWPERVVPKCATDRSFAIAHGLEDVFWVENAAGRWQARATPLRPVEELVRERRSPAVKSALENLVDAPGATGAPKRGRKGK